MTRGIPHVRVVVAFCVAGLGAYLGFSLWVVFWSSDAALIGDTIGTWKSFAVAIFSFWVGSSSGGKALPEAPIEPAASGKPEDPVHTVIEDK